MQLAKYAKMPTHLRWELYPLAGETSRPWGGSYLEESEWWTKPAEEKSFLGEMKFMGEEILFFKHFFHLNRSFWYFVYPFHIGLFTYFIGFFAMLLIGALMMLGGIAISATAANVWGKLVFYLTLVTGGAGLVFGALGSAGLLVRRILDDNLKPYTRRIDYFNLLLVLVVFLTGFFAWVLADPTFATARQYVKGLITFSSVSDFELLIAAHIMLALLFLAYTPFTNMMHFFAKWFTYHKVRWDDMPNLRGSKLEQGLGPLLNQPVSWSAMHIQHIKRWSDAAQVTTDRTPRIQKGVVNEQEEI